MSKALRNAQAILAAGGELRGNQRAPVLMLIANAVVVLLVALFRGPHAGLGAAIWSCLGWAIWLIRPGSKLQSVGVERFLPWQKVVTVIVCVITVVSCTVPMSFCKIWNGEEQNYRDEYEILADALLEGKVSVFDDDDTSALQALDNPYDPAQREGVPYRYDCAYYKGKYYVYFGVVPAVLLFMPYKVLTGERLTGYHATQVFAALLVVAVFLLFLKMLRAFRFRMPFGLYLLLCTVSSVVCVLFAMETPSLYLAAVVSAMAFELWSLYFFIDAVYCREGKTSQIPVAMAGALCGALVFGCRPSIGLMNALVLPMFLHYVKGKSFSLKEAGKVGLVVLPYVVVAAGLMAYNYVRFESPFDFGAAYQLTIIDVAAYANSVKSMGLPFYLDALRRSFFYFEEAPNTFPFVTWGGAVCNFPFLLYCLYNYQGRALAELHKRGLLGMLVLLSLLPIIETVIVVKWSPLYYEHCFRYQMDMYPSLVLLLLLAMASTFILEEERFKSYSFVLSLLLLATLVKCVLLFCVEYDYNWVYEMPSRVDTVWKVLTIGHLFA